MVFYSVVINALHSNLPKDKIFITICQNYYHATLAVIPLGCKEEDLCKLYHALLIHALHCDDSDIRKSGSKWNTCYTQ